MSRSGVEMMQGLLSGHRASTKPLYLSAWLLFACLLLVPLASGQDSDDQAVQAVYQGISAKRSEIQQAQAVIDTRRSALEAARQNLRDARSALSSAETELRIARDRSLSSQSASNYLSATRETLDDLRRQRTSATGSERDVLDAQIRALRRQLDEEARRYGRASLGRQSALDRALTAVSRANAEVETATAQVRIATTALSRAEEQKRAREAELGGLLERAAQLSENAAPPFLQEIVITQDGREVYRASWSENTEEYDLVVASIQDLENQLRGFENLRAELLREQTTYQRTINIALAELPGLREELEWNEGVILWSDRLYNFGQLLLLIATPASIVEGVYLETTAMIANVGRANVTRAALTQFIAREIPRQTALNVGLTLGSSGLPNFLVWPEYAQRVGRFFGVVSNVNTARQMLMTANSLTEPIAAGVTLYQTYGGVSGAVDGSLFADSVSERYNDADQRRFDERMRRAIRRIDSYNNDVLDFTASMNARRQYEMQASLMAGWALEDVNSAIRDRENSWARTLLVGHMWETNADIAMAYDLAQIRYWESMRDGYRGFVRLVDRDLVRLAALRTETEDRLRDLREELPGAAVRRLTVHTNDLLRQDNSGYAEITLTFSHPVTATPNAQIGAGAAVAWNGAPAGDGLPLPDLEGSVLAELTGNGRNWSGRFPLRPLREQFERGEPLQIVVSGADAAGKSLDADPRTSARTNQYGNWTYSEAVRSGDPIGSGGPDRWHELNVIGTGGTSYVFVVDASGSMAGPGIQNVRRSARSFLASMEDSDEVAVFAFFDCGNIQLLTDFTRDKAAVLQTIDGINHASGTPLAAAITMGGNFLLESAHYDRRSLIVLTDGEESCSGDPQAAAAQFRREANLLGDIGNSSVETDPGEREDEPADPPEQDEEEVVAVQPDERAAWRVEQVGSQSMPTFLLIETRFREWGRDNECAAQVTEQRFYTYYGASQAADGTERRRFGVNSTPSSSDTLDFALCIRGQAGMDRIRSQWANLNGSDFETARSSAQQQAYRALRDAP